MKILKSRLFMLILLSIGFGVLVCRGQYIHKNINLNCYYGLNATNTAYVNCVNELGYKALKFLDNHNKDIDNLSIAPPGLFSLITCYENKIEPVISSPIDLLHLPDSLSVPTKMLAFSEMNILDSQKNFFTYPDSVMNMVTYNCIYSFYDYKATIDNYTFCQQDRRLPSKPMYLLNGFNCKYSEDDVCHLVVIPLDFNRILILLLPKNTNQNPIDLLNPHVHHTVLANREWKVLELMFPAIDIKRKQNISPLFTSSTILQDISLSLSAKHDNKPLNTITPYRDSPLTDIYKKKNIKPSETKLLFINRPFAYILQDQITGIYLLMGVIEKFE